MRGFYYWMTQAGLMALLLLLLSAIWAASQIGWWLFERVLTLVYPGPPKEIEDERY